MTAVQDFSKKSHHYGIIYGLQVQMFYNHIDQPLKRTIDCAARGRLRKISAEKAWATIEELARYEDEGWNDPAFPEEESLSYKNPDIEQLLGIMESHVGALMKDAISIMKKSEDIFGISSKMMHPLPPEPSCQEAFKDLTMSKRTRTKKSTRGPSSRSQEPAIEDKIQELGVFDSDVHQGNYFAVSRRPIHPRDVIDWDFLATTKFFDSINTDPFTGLQWANLSQINELVYLELVWEFFASFEFKSTSCRLDSTKRGLNKGETVRAEVLTMGFWPNIGDGDFIVGGAAVRKIRDPKVRVTCNIPYWLARYLKGVRDKDLTCEEEHVVGPTTRQVGEDDEVEDAANVEAGASAEVYRNMGRGELLVRQASGMELTRRALGAVE
ncbi:hypothetical protein Tco_0401144 [Tanacetum coccineum]